LFGRRLRAAIEGINVLNVVPFRFAVGMDIGRFFGGSSSSPGRPPLCGLVLRAIFGSAANRALLDPLLESFSGVHNATAEL
jgi:hypothetical protein